MPDKELVDLERRSGGFSRLVRAAEQEADAFEPPELPDPQDIPDQEDRARRRRGLRRAARTIRRAFRVSTRIAVQAAALARDIRTGGTVITLEWMWETAKAIEERASQAERRKLDANDEAIAASRTLAELQQDPGRTARDIAALPGCRLPPPLRR